MRPSFDQSYDNQGMYSLLQTFPEQCAQACRLKIPGKLRGSFDRLCLVGMGGSGIALEVIQSIAGPKTAIPIFLHRNYGLPAWVGPTSLVICSSYSGNTEEVLSAYRQAKRKGCLIGVITSGGKLLALAQEDRYPAIVVPGKLPPRCALGYMFFPLLRWMRNLQILPRSPSLKVLLKIVSFSVARYLSKRKLNYAQKLALLFRDHVPVLYSDQESFPAALRWKQQLAENSKMFVTIGVLPEMNHNEIMAWHFPAWLITKALPVFFTGHPVDAKLLRRFMLTKRIIRPQSKNVVTVTCGGKTLIEKLLRLIILGDWVSYYLALLNRVDPTEIQEINLLKKSLSSITTEENDGRHLSVHF
ncbi:MAG: bifunctional phosphoglucose/phosphomannose isomerase [Candidatus Omnitrophica bacterium]|nr:bifunctional phosphoglucose/phosphomannose isomerase [Candidatus Omnitrophota bacterium]